MSEWKPISEYDAMKNKPLWVVFLVSRSDEGRINLPRTIVTERRYGFREITHYLVIPEPPDEPKVER